MKTVKNTARVLKVDLFYGCFRTCYKCGKEIEHNTYMHDRCWKSSTSREQDAASNLLTDAITRQLDAIEVPDETD